ncbi:two-component system response regulator [Nocardioides silvaticus]|uniref:Two-component system response regulator n=1 Tax=Nocardioides silvaticus TaxID=2201891 RepID=A0A316TRV4_9ACTN|nr:GGDEF domain-containing phosphodiesterase [Nocardioides silvaticus]PWN02366.1 two-component system response regulator [Nocardioides silvaticus]
MGEGETGRQAWRGRAAEWLPRGGVLSDGAWRARHRGICVLLWLHAIVLSVASVLSQQSLAHGAADASAVGWLALAATTPRFGRRLRSASATLGLMTSSALVVHLTGGLIEAHFHFFVMVAVVALYQAWLPYLLGLAFVVAHHSVVGTIAPHAVYNHAAAADNPWLWGLIHGAFVLAESAACLVYWRASEAAVDRERAARVEAETAHRELADAQALSGVGSWEWDQVTQAVTWSEQLYALAGVDPDFFTPTIEGFLELVHPEDRERVAGLLRKVADGSGSLDYECRLLRPDGEIRTIHALGEVAVDLRGGHTGMRGTCHDVTDRKKLEDAITRMALEDPLTGLANRRVFSDRLDEAVVRASSAGRVCAVLFIDLDGFKVVNDTHGHAAGDAVLTDVARRLRSSVRQGDTIARLGGDEFAVLCEATDLDAVAETAARIEEELSYVAVIDGQRVRVSASVGFATADRAGSPDTLLRRADEAMYASKSRADDQPETAGVPVSAPGAPPARLVEDLDAALDQQQFWLVYQPIVDLASEQRLGVEALIRWMHPARGLLNPADFIGPAEVSGQILPIGEWALRSACDATARLAPDTYTSVNISGRQLGLRGLAAMVADALDASGLPAERLVLEVTETAIVADLDNAVARLGELKELGVRIALDDFGTGYSPLTHVRSLPVDILKIDRTFVRNVEHSEEDRAIVRGVIEIANRLDLRTVAEGIETPDQLEALRELGCESGQGYLWTWPVALDEALHAAR